jgi:hypothetical protein
MRGRGHQSNHRRPIVTHRVTGREARVLKRQVQAVPPAGQHLRRAALQLRLRAQHVIAEEVGGVGGVLKLLMQLLEEVAGVDVLLLELHVWGME